MHETAWSVPSPAVREGAASLWPLTDHMKLHVETWLSGMFWIEEPVAIR